MFHCNLGGVFLSAVATFLGATLWATPPVHAAKSVGGDLLWEDQFDLAEGQDRAKAVAVAHGRVVVAGNAQNSSGDTDFLVRAYDAKHGELVWEDRVDLAGGADGAEAVVMDGKRVVVSGSGEDATGSPQRILRVYDAKTGALNWESLSPGIASGLAMEGSRILAAETVASIGVQTLVVHAYKANTGVVDWENQALPLGYDRVRGSSRGLVIRGQRAFVAATVASGPGGTSFPFSACLVRAYDMGSGIILWESIRLGNPECSATAIDRR